MAPKRTKQGTWEVRWRDSAGNGHRKRFKRQEDARQHEIEVLAKVQAGTFVAPKRGTITVTEWSEMWLTSAHNLRPRSRLIYEDALKHILPALGEWRLSVVTPEMVEEYLARRTGETSPYTVLRDYRTLRRMFKVAVERQRLPRSPIDQVAAPRVPRTEMLFLTADQLEAAATGIDARWRTLALVAGWGGLRWGECAGLKVERVDVRRRMVQIAGQLDGAGKEWTEPKTDRSRRWVSLPGSVMDELADHIEGRQGWVWTMPGGGPLEHSRWMERYWRPAMDKVGLGTLTVEHTYGPGKRRKRVITSTSRRYEGATFHDLRHTAVALAIASGAHPKAIQARMGHATIAVTMDRYGHLFPEADSGIADTLDKMRTKTRPKLRAV